MESTVIGYVFISLNEFKVLKDNPKEKIRKTFYNALMGGTGPILVQIKYNRRWSFQKAIDTSDHLKDFIENVSNRAEYCKENKKRFIIDYLSTSKLRGYNINNAKEVMKMISLLKNRQEESSKLKTLYDNCRGNYLWLRDHCLNDLNGASQESIKDIEKLQE